MNGIDNTRLIEHNVKKFINRIHSIAKIKNNQMMFFKITS
jgi:hypothetical protein